MDEFAAAIAKITQQYKAESPELFGVSSINDGSHWLIYGLLGLPFGLVGMTAAVRNISGSRITYNKLKQIMSENHEKIRNIEDQLGLLQMINF